jgi:heme oxygenase
MEPMTNISAPMSTDQVPATKDPLATIRSHTRGLHERIESSVDLAGCLHSHQAYGQLLCRYLGLYQTFESLLTGLPGRSGALAAQLYRPKTELLRLDIEFVAPGAAQNVLRAGQNLFPELSVADNLLGALYVVEGSALGGRYIAREVQQKLGIEPGSGGAFFHGDGEATSAHWKYVTATLNREVTDAALAAEAASQMFLVFEHCLTLSGQG